MASPMKNYTLNNKQWTSLGAPPFTLLIKTKQSILIYLSDTPPASLEIPAAAVLTPRQDGSYIASDAANQVVYARAFLLYPPMDVDITTFA